MQKQDELGVRFGKYNVFAKLAVGGMAELFLAKQPGIGGFKRTVVLKCILPHLASEDDFVTMFLDEARVVAPLDHPNIVQIYDLGEEAGVYFIAMEYIRGQTLKEFRKKLYRQNPDVKPYKLSAGLIAQAAAGLHYAHVAHNEDDGTPLHLVHRDVSPTNLIVSYNGVVKLVDFGVAKASNQQHQTSAGTIKGKYRYMSPEQIRGLELDARSDVFSLGIVLYELSTNAALFGRRHEAEIIDAVRNARVPKPSKFRPDYPEDLETIVMKALHPDRELRYQSADELRIDLERYMRDEGAYYGTTQLAELMQYLFSKEQSNDRTGITHKPLSPADFVRFLGDFPNPAALASYSEVYPSRSKSDTSYPAARSASASSWPVQGSNAQLSGAHPATHTPPPASRFSSASSPSQPQIPHAEALELPEETRTQLSAANYSIEPELRVEEEALSSMVIEDPVDTQPEQASIQKRSVKRSGPILWIALFICILLLGTGGYLLYSFQKTSTPHVSFAQQKERVEQLIRSQKFTQAGAVLHSIVDAKLTPEQLSWKNKAQQATRIGPQLTVAKRLFEQKQYSTCIPLFEQIQKQAPQHEETRQLLRRAQELLRKQQAAVPKTVAPEPIRRIEPPIARRRRVRRRRQRRYRNRGRRKKRPVRVAVLPRPVVRKVIPQMGTLYLQSSPSRIRVMINGQLFGYTPIIGKQLKVGSYQVHFHQKGYISTSRRVEIRVQKNIHLRVRLRRIRTIVERRPPQPPRRVVVAPKKRSTGARYPFTSVRLARRKQLRIYITDPRGLAGRHSTLQLRKMARIIEREAARLLGSRFRVRGVTRAWQRTIRRRATQRNQDYHTFYPRAVAYIIYRDLLRGRSLRRVAQVLVKYEYRNRFRSIRK